LQFSDVQSKSESLTLVLAYPARMAALGLSAHAALGVMIQPLDYCLVFCTPPIEPARRMCSSLPHSQLEELGRSRWEGVPQSVCAKTLNTNPKILFLSIRYGSAPRENST
jgi:hypothetical protein